MIKGKRILLKITQKYPFGLFLCVLIIDSLFCGTLTAGAKTFDWGSQIYLAETRFTMPTSHNPTDDINAGASVVTVTSSAELNAALNAATGGEAILLEDGNYGDLAVMNRQFSEFVTIRAAEGSGVTFRKIDVSGSSYLRFDGLKIEHPLADGEPDWTRAFEIRNGSNNIQVLNSEFFGSVDENPNNDGYGLSVRDGNSIIIEGNTFHDLVRGVIVSNSDNIIVNSNTAYHIRSDAFDFAQVSDVLVENNIGSKFIPTRPDHPDFIQFWNADSSSHGITIRGNILISPENIDGLGVQGIFMRATYVDGGEDLIFEDVTIENNIIYTAMHNGITLAGTSNATIDHNTVLSPPGDVIAKLGVLTTSGVVNKNVLVSNNVATVISVQVDGVQADNNTTAQWEDPSADEYIDKLFLNARAATQAGDFLPVPGSPIDFGSGLGAEQLLAAIEKPLVYIETSTGPNGIDSKTVTFTAAPYPGGGPVEGPDVEYRWTFADGTEATGQSVTHTFQSAGVQPVQVTVVSGGTSATIGKSIAVKNQLLVDLEFEDDLANQGGSGGALTWVGTKSYADGVDGTAASFASDGTNYIKASGARAELSGMDQLTLSFAFRAEAVGGTPLWLHTAYGIHFTSDGTIKFYVSTDNGFSPALAIMAPQVFDGDWHHLMASYDALTGTATLYMDGNAIGTKTGLSGPVGTSIYHDLTIGADSWGDGFDGQIDNLRIYNGIVPPDQEEQILKDLRGTTGDGEPPVNESTLR